MKPTKPVDVLNRGPNWKPTTSGKTDVAATIRAYQRRRDEARKQKAELAAQKVRVIR